MSQLLVILLMWSLGRTPGPLRRPQTQLVEHLAQLKDRTVPNVPGRRQATVLGRSTRSSSLGWPGNWPVSPRFTVCAFPGSAPLGTARRRAAVFNGVVARSRWPSATATVLLPPSSATLSRASSRPTLTVRSASQYGTNCGSPPSTKCQGDPPSRPMPNAQNPPVPTRNDASLTPSFRRRQPNGRVHRALLDRRRRPAAARQRLRQLDGPLDRGFSDHRY